MKTPHCLALLAALASFPAIAQQASCPPLPAGSGLQWQRTAGDGFIVCRAMVGDRQLLGMMLTSKPTISPRRSDRREEGYIGAHPVHWHQPEIADGSGTWKRVTVVELGRRHYAQVWIDAGSEQELQRLVALAQGIALE